MQLDLPLPNDTEPSDGGILNEGGSLPAIPREYLWPYYESYNFGLDEFLGFDWYKIPADERYSYKTEMTEIHTVSFYIDEMGQKGWNLIEGLYRLPGSFLMMHYMQGERDLVLILESDEIGGTFIGALMPSK